MALTDELVREPRPAPPAWPQRAFTRADASKQNRGSSAGTADTDGTPHVQIQGGGTGSHTLGAVLPGLDRIHMAVGRTHEPAQEAVGTARTAALMLSPRYHPPCATSTLRVGACLTAPPSPGGKASRRKHDFQLHRGTNRQEWQQRDFLRRLLHLWA